MSTRDDDDLDAWLDALRGRTRTSGPPATQAEAAAERAALVAEHARRAAADPDPQELQRILFRLRREGLLGTEERAPARAWRLRVPLAAAAVLALGLAITLIGPALWHGGEEPVLRGGAAVQSLEVDAAQVEVTALRVQQALQSVGATVIVRDIGGGAREVAATVPAERLAGAARALAPLGLEPPAADGTLRVEVRPRGATK